MKRHVIQAVQSNKGVLVHKLVAPPSDPRSLIPDPERSPVCCKASPRIRPKTFAGFGWSW